MKRILVAGGGLIGARHVDAVLNHPACRLVGLVDPDPRVESPQSVRRFSRLVDVEEAVDGVILATPTHLHTEQGIFAASRGWHMLIEKPVSDDLASAQQLTDAVARSGVGSLVGHHRRYHACVHQLRDLINNGGLGIPITVSLIWAMRKPDPYFQGNWRTAGGSPVMINLVHDIDLLRFVLGEIVATSALRGKSLRNERRIETGAIGVAFENGATGTISFADTAPSPWGFEAGTGENPNIGNSGQDMMWITGSKGAISFPSMTLWHGTDWSTPAQQVPLEKKANDKAPLEAQLDHFLEVMSGAVPLIDIADATRTLEVALDIESQLRAQTIGERNVRSALA